MAMPLHRSGSLMTLDEWIALPEDNSYQYERVPDLVVTKAGAAQPRLVASDVVLAVEIISSGSRNLKPFEYAQAQIPHYWIVDLDPPAPSITVFPLGAPGDGYIEAPATAGQLVTTVPFDLRIDIPALVAPRS